MSQKSNKNVLIRVDGDAKIGLGHLVRCIALAHMLKTDFDIYFYCKEIPEMLLVEIETSGFHCKKIKSENEFIGRLTKNTIVVLDGYRFDIGYQRLVKASGALLVIIDDLHNKEYLADLIINHTPGITPKDYLSKSFTEYALGLKYALLRPAFLKQTKETRKIDKLENVFICFGGSDPKNLTEKSLKVMLKYPFFKKIIVITGLVFKKSISLISLIKSDGRIYYYNSLNEHQMVKLMLTADFAIAPSSTILLELFAVGVPVLTGYYTENQMEASRFVGKIGAALDLGNLEFDLDEKIFVHLNQISNTGLNNMVTIQKKYMIHSGTNILSIFHKIL